MCSVVTRRRPDREFRRAPTEDQAQEYVPPMKRPKLVGLSTAPIKKEALPTQKGAVATAVEQKAVLDSMSCRSSKDSAWCGQPDASASDSNSRTQDFFNRHV